MEFTCTNRKGKKLEKWYATVESIEDCGSIFDILIASRSSIRVIVGYSSHGNFVCAPDFKIGCDLSDFKDIFWNTERLTKLMGKVDGITTATVIHGIADILDRNYADDYF